MSREIDAETIIRHISENQRLIVRQRNLVAFLKASDYDTGEAERNLAELITYAESLETMQAHQTASSGIRGLLTPWSERLSWPAGASK